MKISALITVLFFALLSNTSLMGGEADFSSDFSGEVNISLYPNPVVDGTLTVSAEKEITRLDIVNIVGEHILSEEEPEPSTSVRLDVNNLKSGIYLIKVTFVDNTSNTKRIWVK